MVVQPVAIIKKPKLIKEKALIFIQSYTVGLLDWIISMPKFGANFMIQELNYSVSGELGEFMVKIYFSFRN